jgi:hypothetical protein
LGGPVISAAIVGSMETSHILALSTPVTGHFIDLISFVITSEKGMEWQFN